MPTLRVREIDFGRSALLVFLLFSLIGFLSLCEFQLVHLRGLVSTDEYFFSACAVRGLAQKLVPVFGCHDNKGPVIFLVYELIFAAFGYYNFLATKIATYLACAIYAFVLGKSAYRISGWPGMLMTLALTLLSLSSNILNLALRTELVGALFLATALAVLSNAPSRPSLKRVALSGLLIGVAVITKQPFAFAALGVVIWLFLEERPATLQKLAPVLSRAAVFGLCVLLPFFAFWLIFQFQGYAKPFLASVFLYPMVYGEHRLYTLIDWIKRLFSLFAALNYNIILVSGAVAAAVAVAFQSAHSANWHRSQLAALRLNAWVGLCLFLFLTISPLWWPYYIVGISPPLLMLAGNVAGFAWQRMEKELPEALPPVGTGLAAIALILAAHTWMSNGDYRRAEIMLPASVMHDATSGPRYAFQMGVQPDFYAIGNFVPASSVQFLWALPGTPSALVYTRPRPESLVGRVLASTQSENQRQLIEDFRLTPPSMVLLESNWVRSQDSTEAVDIPLLRSYLQTHCKPPSQNLSDGKVVFLLYQCGESSTKP